MAESYPFTHFEHPLTPEPNLMQDIALRLGWRAVRSEAVVVANIQVPDEDVARVLAGVPRGAVSVYSDAPLGEVLMTPSSVATSEGMRTAFEGVLGAEKEAHDLVKANTDFRAELQTSSLRTPLEADWHLDAFDPYRGRRVWGQRAPASSFDEATYGGIRYVVSFGPDARETGTRFVTGRVKKSDLRNQARLNDRGVSYDSGVVVRFASHSGVHERSPVLRPRVFMSGTRWRRNVVPEAA